MDVIKDTLINTTFSEPQAIEKMAKLDVLIAIARIQTYYNPRVPGNLSNF